MKILIVTKDGAPFRALHPLALALGNTGHKITVVAEGLSLNQWINKTDHHPIRFDSAIQSGRTLEEVKPDIVIVGLSSPINGEDVLSAEANRRNIPVVAFSDTWGATSRLKCGEPNLVLTIDKIDGRIAQENFPQAKVLVVGDWINTPIQNPRNIWAKDKFSLFIAGQNPATLGEFVKVALERIKNAKNWQVCFTAHPKYKDVPEVNRAMEYLKQSEVTLVAPGEASGDDLASTADLTISSFSGALRVAVLASKSAVSVETNLCITQMENSTGLRKYPLIETGCCKGTSERFTLEELLEAVAHLELCRHYRESVWPDRMNDAVGEITTLAGG